MRTRKRSVIRKHKKTYKKHYKRVGGGGGEVDRRTIRH
jgi:hypothetical protein